MLLLLLVLSPDAIYCRMHFVREQSDSSEQAHEQCTQKGLHVWVGGKV